MDIKLLVVFILLNIANVIIQTVKSIVTIKCGKMMAALVNAIAYGLYTIVTVYMLCDLPLMAKAGIVALCNLVGVYVVKWGEEKARKDKLWKVEATFAARENFLHNMKIWATINHITYSYIDIEKYYIVNFYCATQRESTIVKEFIYKFGGKYFVSESKTL